MEPSAPLPYRPAHLTPGILVCCFNSVKPYTLVKCAVTVTIGLLVGLLAVALGRVTEGVITAKNSLVRRIIHQPAWSPEVGIVLAGLAHIAYSVALVLIGSGMVQFWAPAAGGAGVSLIMAYLNGNAIPDLLSARSLITKWVGTACGVCANIALGPEAPTIHMGACVAHNITHLACSLCERWDGLSGCWGGRRRRGRATPSGSDKPLKAPLLGGPGGRCTCSGRGRARAGNGPAREGSLLAQQGSGVEQGGGWAEQSPTLHPTGGGSCEAAAEEVGTSGPAALLHSDADRREFISAGAAAGLAAAFGAPIGGVLFSMEEACTHWSRKVAWRCFVCTTVAVIAVAQLNPEWKRGVLSFKGVKEMASEEWLFQLPLFALVSICSGALGALFNALHKMLRRYRAPRSNNTLRMLEAAGLAAITVNMMLGLSYFAGTCVDVPDWHEKDYGFTFHCTDGRYNDLATAFMSFPDKTIGHLFSLGSLSPQYEVCQGENCYFTLHTLIVLCPSYLVFMALNGGLAVPGGLFMPSIMVGGSFGATCGLLLMKWLPGSWHIQPGVYAMCAAAAMLGGVFRASLSVVVIFVEGSQSTKFIVGIIIAVICSNWVSEAIHSDGIYETDLEADGSVIFLRPSPPPALFAKTAGQIASKPVWTFRSVESVAYVTWVLRHCGHNGFPVVRGSPGDSSEEEDDDNPEQADRENGDALSSPSSSGEEEEEGVTSDGNGCAQHAANRESVRRFRRKHRTRSAFADWQESAPSASRDGPLEGVILRSQLMVLLTKRVFCDGEGAPLSREQASETLSRELALDREMRMYHRHSDTHTWRMGRGGRAAHAPPPAHANGWQRLASYNPFHRDAESLRQPRLYMDLRPYIDCGPITVRSETPAERAHMAFVGLGLRHLVVTDEASCVRGIITRRNLDQAAGHGAWRRNRMAPERAQPRPPAAGVDVPSRTSSGALLRLTALRHVLGSRVTSARSAADLAQLLSYGNATPDVERWLASSAASSDDVPQQTRGAQPEAASPQGV